MVSSRLLGKSMKKIGTHSLIEMILKRVDNSQYLDEVVLATTKLKEDDILEEEARNLGFKVYRGSTNDILQRFCNASAEYEPFAVVRITGDCPLISP